MTLEFPGRTKVFSASIILVGVVIMLGVALNWAFSHLDVMGPEDPVESHMSLFEKGQGWYLEDRSSVNRSGLLWVGEMLANDLAYNRATAEQRPAVASQLDWVLRYVGKAGMSEKELGQYERISVVLSTYQSQQAQIQAIEAKQCGAISAASIAPGGQPTVSAVEIVCP